MRENKSFYFTYGTSDCFPYRGGWTEVIAPDRETAVYLFRIYHPDHTPGTVNCAGIYTREQFESTGMHLPSNGNFGHNGREVIALRIRLYDTH